MSRSLLICTVLLAGCGPKSPPTQEPPPPEVEDVDGMPPGAEQEPAADTEPEPAEETAGKPPAAEEAKPEWTSASEGEVKPLYVKDYDVIADITFSPKLAPEKKEKAMEKVGMAVGEVTGCYKKILEEDRELEGKMKVTLKVNVAGIPKPVKVEDDTTGNDALRTCVFKAFKKLKFPKKLVPGKPVTVTIPLTFLPYKKGE